MNDMQKQQDQPALAHAVKTMPRWKWKLLAIALVIGCIGVAGQAVSMYNRPAPTQHVVTHVTPASPGVSGAPAGSSGFVSGQPAVAPETTTTVTTTTSTDGSPAAVVTPFMTRVGFSLFVGVIVGLIFRTFLKMALMITTLIVGAAMALSYFHILNVDLTVVRNESAQATNWLTDQGYRLKDMLFHALPSSTSAAVGFLFGFKKK